MANDSHIPDFSIKPIGIVHSCFKEKFAIPRQPALAPAAKGEIELLAPYNDPVALEGLEEVSHLWLSFIFHQALPKEGEVRLRVRPPRLGGNKKIGVFATRATHRPNPLGLSVVKLDGIKNGRLQISGIDLLDGTPIVDIKPYVPYADIVPAAFNHIANTSPELSSVEFNSEAFISVQNHSTRLEQPVKELIEQMLAQDPKPAYQKPDPERVYGVKIWDLEVKWCYPLSTEIESTEATILVTSVTQASI
ncbi:tRNA (N6-threonylcarbamoyladenosine(37)-N6)-methyltransferase TrmO [Oleispira antarctica]|uniref:tRNA (N6-threonylcarbamoyladenosine(37)-N6)-methyltransferase TrmO n=1 Tax=Oleispira antarctica TaxID=188908 RepID=A0A1Y5HSR9_OLEAN|nr:tRNA (N6-threonylcarbamoyladenosine(37)-N6)-methyltransferase TrmO [Oleispira antarctica]